MSRFVTISQANSGAVVLRKAEWTVGFWGHFKGLMLRRTLPDDEGLLFVYGRESKADTSIHMLFMYFPIATVWLDKNLTVVDKVLAKTWRPAYIPAKPAQYFIEARPLVLEQVQIGDTLRFEDLV